MSKINKFTKISHNKSHPYMLAIDDCMGEQLIQAYMNGRTDHKTISPTMKSSNLFSISNTLYIDYPEL